MSLGVGLACTPFPITKWAEIYEGGKGLPGKGSSTSLTLCLGR